MKFLWYILKPVLVGLLAHVVGILAFFLMPFTLPFIRWDKTETLDKNGLHSAVRGDLPYWLSWFSTPDERLPGGLYEPTVAKVYAKWGRTVCAWYWLGVRNRAHGFTDSFGVETDGFWPPEYGVYWDKPGLWWMRLPLGPLSFKAGYRIYKLLDGTFLAVPVFTVTKK